MTADEQVFLDTPGAKVTSARVIIGNQTFAMSGITSVEAKRVDYRPSWLPGLILVLLGIAALPSMPPIGIVLVVSGVYQIVREHHVSPTFHLMFRTAGGEVSALKSNDGEVVDTIANAITDAIVFRG